eukprot:3122474-Rhodomonas_salina.3
MLSEKGDLDLRGGKHSPSSRIPWLTTLLGVLGFSFVAGLFLWWRVRHHDSLAKPVALLHPPTMNVDPLARCQMDKQEYTVRNGKAALRPNRRGHRQEECAGRSNGLVVPATAECPFLIAVYRPQPDVYDIVSNAIRTQGFWEPRESGIIEDLVAFFVSSFAMQSPPLTSGYVTNSRRNPFLLTLAPTLGGTRCWRCRSGSIP